LKKNAASVTEWEAVKYSKVRTEYMDLHKALSASFVVGYVID